MITSQKYRSLNHPKDSKKNKINLNVYKIIITTVKF